MATRLRWVFFLYRLPRNPSTPRITLWRSLRRLGVVQLADGLVALPLDARTKEQLESGTTSRRRALLLGREPA